MRYRLLAVYGVATLLATCPASGWSAPKTGNPTPVWAQAISDLPADPAVRFGTLPNGMRYAILKNVTPPGQVSFRFRIGAGSIQETPDQQGIAHFLEHMAFRGSTHVPDGEVFHRMERLGAALGADTNASTAWTETVYKFDLPHGDASSIDTALTLMRETASELLLKPAAVNSERAVILSEERVRDTPPLHAAKDELAFFYKDQPYGDHLPIGSVEVINKVGAADIKRFYDAYYRPERATLIVVGDVDVDAIEAQIKARFANWKGRGPAGADPVFGPPLPRGAEYKLHAEAGTSPMATVAWTTPAHTGPDSEAYEIDDTVKQVALAALNQRLQDEAHGANPPFIAALSRLGQVAHSATQASLAVVTSKDGWKAGLEAVLRAQREILAQGFRQDEVDRQVTVFRTALGAAKAAAGTRTTPALAAELLKSVDDAEVFLHPATAFDVVEKAVKDLTAEKVNAAFRQCFGGNGPLVFMSAPEAPDGGEAALAAAVTEAAQAPLPADAARAEVSWPYSNFGPAGHVAEQTTVDDLGLTYVRFDNGVRLTIKPTKFRDDQILVAATFGNGLAGVDRKSIPAIRAYSGAFMAGGLKDLSVPDIQRLEASKVVGVSFAVDERYFLFSGATRPQDFDTEMQLLTAYFVAPGWRAEGLEATRNWLKISLPQMDSSPNGVFQKNREALLYDGDPRWSWPSLQDIDAVKLEALRSDLDPALAQAPIEVVVVGNITVERAIAAVEATLGALPPRAAKADLPPSALDVRFPAGNATPVTLFHKGRADQALAIVAWPTLDFIHDLQTPRDVTILHAILQQRLFDEFRTKIGGTYSPGGEAHSSFDFPGYGYDLYSVETPPDKIAIFNETVARIVADLKSVPVSDDELERLRKPKIEGILKAQQTNEYWLSLLQYAQTDPRRIDIIRSTVPDYRQVTAASVQKAAQTYLRDDSAWHLVIVPQP